MSIENIHDIMVVFVGVLKLLIGYPLNRRALRVRTGIWNMNILKFRDDLNHHHWM